MGFTLTTDDKGTKIFRHDKISAAGNAYSTFSAGVSSKDKDGNWVNGFIDVAFKKGMEVANKTVIKVKNAFPTVREYNGKTYVSWFIMDYDIVTAGDEKPTGFGAINADFSIMNDSDLEELPFN